MTIAPNTDNYTLGKGVLYFGRFDANGVSEGWQDLGNCPAFSVQPTIETLDHFSSREGLKEKDKTVNISVANTARFTLDEYSAENLALAILSTAPTTETQATGAAVAETFTAAHDKWVDLTYRNVLATGITVEDAGGGGAYVEGTDYALNYKRGMIKILSTGSIADDAAMQIGYGYSGETWNLLNAVSSTDIEGALLFIGDPEEGVSYEMEIWKGKLRIAGELNFISDDWATMEFEYEVEKDETNHPTNPWYVIREEGTAGGGS